MDGDLYYTDDPLRVYLHLFGTVPPLQEGEADELFRHVRAADEQAEAAKKRLVKRIFTWSFPSPSAIAPPDFTSSS